MNRCSGCKQDFGSVSAFDAHRTGTFLYDWALDHENGRRCLTTAELQDLGWRKDNNGRWRTPRPDVRALFRARARTERAREGQGKGKGRGGAEK